MPRAASHRLFAIAGLAAALLPAGCQLFVDDADREVYRLIETRQRDALGQTEDARIDHERSPSAGLDKEAYAFVPHRTDLDVPESFRRPAPSRAAPTTQPTDEPQPAPDTTRPAGAATAPADDAMTSSVLDTHSAESETRPADVGAFGAASETQAADNRWTETPPPERTPSRYDRYSRRGARPATQPGDGETEHTFLQSGPVETAATQPAMPERPILTLEDALRYAFRRARTFQSAKEDLYLSALALTLERHLWTPRFMGEIGASYAETEPPDVVDRAMEAVAEVGVEQRLPYGGAITARVLNNLIRDMERHVTTAESGTLIMEANLPLLRGAGTVAYETRYRAERELIYAVRTLENYRRQFAVDIAGDYFDLQQLRQQIVNTNESVVTFTKDVEKARSLWQSGRRTQLDVLRADQTRLGVINRQIAAIEQYETALDRFKIRLGMPTETAIDVELPSQIGAVNEPAAPTTQPATLIDALRMPAVSEAEAIAVALRQRLDLLTVRDQIDDAKRGVKIAENALLPSLDATASVEAHTSPTDLRTLNYSSERTSWRAGLTMELPLDRKAERNALRESQISVRRAERNYDEARDRIRLEVRRAMRQVELARETLDIERRNRDLAIVRRRAAQIEFEFGKIDNRDLVEAQNALLDAMNGLAQAQAGWRLAVLQFRVDTGTLRVDDDGRWTDPLATARGPR